MIEQFHETGNYQSIWDVFFGSTATVLLEIMTLVAIGLFIVQIINLFARDKLISALENSKNAQPLVGAILGLIPGCGGTIFLVPFYNNKKISFATLTASFISTMGEAAFVLLAVKPIIYLFISAISFGVALITGYTIHFIKKLSNFFDEKIKFKDKNIKHEEHHHNKTPIWFRTIDRVIVPSLFGIVLLLLFPLTIIGLSFPEDNMSYLLERIMIIGEWISFIAILFFICYYIIRSILIKNFFIWEDRIHYHDEKESFHHAMLDTYLNILYITIWVWVGILSIDLIIYGIGYDNIEGWFESIDYLPWLVLILVSLIALIPGCGPQLIILSLFVGNGNNGSHTHSHMTVSGLTANAIIQDGDAGFPLLAENKKAFIWVKLVNFVPGILTGIIMLIIETYIGLPF